MDSAGKKESRQVISHVVHPSLESVYIPECVSKPPCSRRVVKPDNTTGGSQTFSNKA